MTRVPIHSGGARGVSPAPLTLHDHPVWLLGLPLGYVIVMLFVPSVFLCWRAAADSETTFGQLLVQGITSPLYRKVFLNTVIIAAEVTGLCALLGLPVAFLLSHGARKLETVGLLVVLGSLWLSILIRSFAWTIVLQREGPVSAALAGLCILPEKHSFLFTRGAVVVGMTHVLMPYMILILWSSMRRCGRRYREAAMVLGASRTFYLLRVFLPALTPSLLGGVLLVFLMGLGFYITPALLGVGQGNTLMVATLIEEQVNALGHWSQGAVLALLLMTSIVLLVALGIAIRPIRTAWYGLFTGERTGGLVG